MRTLQQIAAQIFIARIGMPIPLAHALGFDALEHQLQTPPVHLARAHRFPVSEQPSLLETFTMGGDSGQSPRARIERRKLTGYG